MKRIVALLAGILVTGCTTLVPPPRTDVVDPESAREAWARVLDRFVDEAGEVDYPALTAAPADLDRYVAFIAATPAETFPAGPPRLAHLIDSYNALSMNNVIASGVPASHDGWRKVRFFLLREHLIGGRRLSLYKYENDVIRPYGDPRVHFALNCSAVSCPRLPRVPFGSGDLDDRLERETRRFFAEARNLRIDIPTRTLWLSAILDFYDSDFVPAHAVSLPAYANRYAPYPVPPDYRIRFAPYDWTIANSRRSESR